MIFTEFLQNSKNKTEQVLKKSLDTWLLEVKNINPEILPLLQAFISASEGGKRIRGSLVKLGYQIVGGQEIEGIYEAAVAYEILQTALLAHDDIIDKSDLRRGKPTLFAALGKDHYALSQTICLADIGFFQAISLIAKSSFPAEQKNKAISFFSKIVSETIVGEMLDIEIPVKKAEITEQLIMQIYQYKTARYTFVGPLQMGAILGGGDNQLLEFLKVFGDYLGKAYQIQDDILGIFGTEEEIGKPITSDIEEGKATLLLVYAKQLANKEQLETLEKLYGKGSISNQDFEKIKQIFLQTGSLDQARAKAVQYVTEAKKLIPEITDTKEYQTLLEELAAYLIDRKK